MPVQSQTGQPLAGSDTVSFQVVDGEGNVTPSQLRDLSQLSLDCGYPGNGVSMVNSLSSAWGSGVVPRGVGFALQNRGRLLLPKHSHATLHPEPQTSLHCAARCRLLARPGGDTPHTSVPSSPTIHVLSSTRHCMQDTVDAVLPLTSALCIAAQHPNALAPGKRPCINPPQILHVSPISFLPQRYSNIFSKCVDLQTTPSSQA